MSRYRFDRNQKVGGNMVYIRKDIPSKLLIEEKLQSDIENISIEINLRLKIQLSSCSYNQKLAHVKIKKLQKEKSIAQQNMKNL